MRHLGKLAIIATSATAAGVAAFLGRDKIVSAAASLRHGGDGPGCSPNNPLPVPSSDAAAKRIPAVAERFRRLWPEVTGESGSMPEAALEIALAQAWLESGIAEAGGGGWWKDKTAEGQGNMVGSGNLGARQCGKTDTGGDYYTCVPYGDSSPNADGTQTLIPASFRYYQAGTVGGKSRNAGDAAAYDFLHTITKQFPALAELKSGSVLDYCIRQGPKYKSDDKPNQTVFGRPYLGGNYYYGGFGATMQERVGSYGRAIISHLPAIAAALGHKKIHACIAPELLTAGAKHAAVSGCCPPVGDAGRDSCYHCGSTGGYAKCGELPCSKCGKPWNGPEQVGDAENFAAKPPFDPGDGRAPRSTCFYCGAPYAVDRTCLRCAKCGEQWFGPPENCFRPANVEGIGLTVFSTVAAALVAVGLYAHKQAGEKAEKVVESVRKSGFDVVLPGGEPAPGHAFTTASDPALLAALSPLGNQGKAVVQRLTDKGVRFQVKLPGVSISGAESAIDAIVPAYNEGSTVGAVAHALILSGAFRRVIVVDDGSIDNTSEAANFSGAEVITLPSNVGKMGAMNAGIDASDASAFAFFDADAVNMTADHAKVLVDKWNVGGFAQVCGVLDHGLMNSSRLATGQRIVSREILEGIPTNCQGYSAETAINHIADKLGGATGTVLLPELTFRTKTAKIGVLEGMARGARMLGEMAVSRMALAKSGGTSCNLLGGVQLEGVGKIVAVVAVVTGALVAAGFAYSASTDGKARDVFAAMRAAGFDVLEPGAERRAGWMVVPADNAKLLAALAFLGDKRDAFVSKLAAGGTRFQMKRAQLKRPKKGASAIEEDRGSLAKVAPGQSATPSDLTTRLQQEQAFRDAEKARKTDLPGTRRDDSGMLWYDKPGASPSAASVAIPWSVPSAPALDEDRGSVAAIRAIPGVTVTESAPAEAPLVFERLNPDGTATTIQGVREALGAMFPGDDASNLDALAFFDDSEGVIEGEQDVDAEVALASEAHALRIEGAAATAATVAAVVAGGLAAGALAALALSRLGSPSPVEPPPVVAPVTAAVPTKPAPVPVKQPSALFVAQTNLQRAKDELAREFDDLLKPPDPGIVTAKTEAVHRAEEQLAELQKKPAVSGLDIGEALQLQHLSGSLPRARKVPGSDRLVWYIEPAIAPANIEGAATAIIAFASGAAVGAGGMAIANRIKSNAADVLADSKEVLAKVRKIAEDAKSETDRLGPATAKSGALNGTVSWSPVGAKADEPDEVDNALSSASDVSDIATGLLSAVSAGKKLAQRNMKDDPKCRAAVRAFAEKHPLVMRIWGSDLKALAGSEQGPSIGSADEFVDRYTDELLRHREANVSGAEDCVVTPQEDEAVLTSLGLSRDEEDAVYTAASRTAGTLLDLYAPGAGQGAMSAADAIASLATGRPMTPGAKPKPVAKPDSTAKLKAELAAEKAKVAVVKEFVREHPHVVSWFNPDLRKIQGVEQGTEPKEEQK